MFNYVIDNKHTDFGQSDQKLDLCTCDCSAWSRLGIVESSLRWFDGCCCKCDDYRSSLFFTLFILVQNFVSRAREREKELTNTYNLKLNYV